MFYVYSVHCLHLSCSNKQYFICISYLSEYHSSLFELLSVTTNPNGLVARTASQILFKLPDNSNTLNEANVQKWKLRIDARKQRRTSIVNGCRIASFPRVLSTCDYNRLLQ